MKKLLLILLGLTLFSANELLSHKFMKYQTWASEKYKDPRRDSSGIDVKYDSIKFVLKGNWSGRTDGNISIPSLMFILTDRQNNAINFYSVESQGYRVLDPTNDYADPRIVNHQEGLSLESAYQDHLYDAKIDTNHCIDCGRDTTWYDTTRTYTNPHLDSIHALNAYTKHPTIRRFWDTSLVQLFPDPMKIKFAVSGNFIGDARSEILMFYYNPQAFASYNIFLARNTSANDSLNYNMSVDSVYRITGFKLPEFIRLVESGDFDGDGMDEVVVFSNRWGINDSVDVSMMKYYNSAWHYDYKTTLNTSLLNPDAILYSVTGDYDGDGTCDIAFFDKVQNTNRIRLMKNNIYTSLSTVYSRSNSYLDFLHISNVVSGNFNGDTTDGGRSLEELAIFYDHGLCTDTTGLGAVQEVFITDHDETNWNYTTVIKEHRSNLNFDKNKTKFAFAGNFDRDIKKRDDLGIVYLGTDSDNQAEYKKVLMWLSLPSFAENDFIMDTTNGNSSGKFIPIGIEGIRLQTGNLDSLTYYNGQKPDTTYVRTNSAEYMNKISKYFNTILVDRVDYTDALNEWSVRTRNSFTRRITNSEFDFWSNSLPTKGYIHALRSYLDSAEKYKMKVIPRMITAHMSVYDDTIANSTQYLAKYTTFDNTQSMPIPSFITNNINDAIIENHHALLGWNIFDEPDSYRNHGRLCEHDFISFQEHFNRTCFFSNTIPLLNDTSRLPATRVMHRNYYNYVKAHTTKNIFGNFHGNSLDFDFFQSNYDIPSFDVYPFDFTRSYNGLSKFVTVSKALNESAIKNNKISTLTWLQGIGNEFVDNGKHTIGTPNYFAQRFSLFSQAIEGMRGFMYFIHPNMLFNDTLNGSIMLAVSEFQNYIPIFMKENLNYKVSTNHDRFYSADYGDGIDFTNFINYSLHYDSTANIYYLFVSNMNYYPNVENVKFSVFVEPNVSNDVYLLSSDYFKTGLYNKLSSTKDGNGNFIQFAENMDKCDIKIYTIGGLPAIRTRADSIGMKGYLSYSNQNKLIAYPKTQNSVRDFGSIDTVRYHAVYHREITPGSGRMGVYYRRSKPMTIDFPQELIDWETQDYLVSNQIIYNGETIDYCANCKYPSIVVRYDSVSENQGIKVYIVYECKGFGRPDYIAETSFFDRNVPLSTGHLLDTLVADDLDKWGQPVVNASYNGNYYAWSDQARGIVAAWKNPSDTVFDFNNKINIRNYNFPSIPNMAAHPSLNVYSRIFLQEEDCALVWEESTGSWPFLYTDVFYSRLRKTQGQPLKNKVPDSSNYCRSYYNLGHVNSDTSILKITNSFECDYHANTLPVIYRINGFENYIYWNMVSYKYDRIYWQSKDCSEKNFIGYFNIDIVDGYNGQWNNVCFDRKCISSIKSLNNFLSQPNVSQGCMAQLPYSYSVKGDSMIILNLVSYSNYFYPDSNTKIWNINHSMESLWNNHNDYSSHYETVTPNVQPIIGHGNNPHLALMPAVTGRIEWLHNRRIFQTNKGTPPEIVSSIFLFAKKNFDDPESVFPFFGYHQSKNKIMITPPWFTDESGLDYNLPVTTHSIDSIGTFPLDTVYTDWFKLDKVKDLNYLVHGTRANDMDIKIERKNDKKKYNLNCILKNDSVFTNHKLKLINGYENEYRILFIKKNPDSRYTEELIIGGLPSVSDLSEADTNNRFKRSLIDDYEEVLDLDESTLQNGRTEISISLYPNPTDEKIFSTAYLPFNSKAQGNSLVIKVYSTLGIELYRHEARSGETLTINTKDYPTGTYFIRAEESTAEYQFDALPTVIKGFVISR